MLVFALVLACGVAVSGVAQAGGAVVDSPSSQAHEPAMPPSRTYFGIGLGAPFPVGGALGVDVYHRLDARSFVQVGAGTSLLVAGFYASYGYVYAPGSFLLAGLDADAYGVFDTKRSPGAHVGLGWEWFPGPTRLGLALTTGFPWMGGARVTVGL
ncbi:MAG: hypothetical protein ACOYOB_13160 [Myxococcota bacterium]